MLRLVEGFAFRIGKYSDFNVEQKPVLFSRANEPPLLLSRWIATRSVVW